MKFENPADECGVPEIFLKEQLKTLRINVEGNAEKVETLLSPG